MVEFRDLSPAAHEHFPCQKTRRLSRILIEVSEDHAKDRISVGDVLEKCGQRAFGAMIFLFAAPNMLPVTMPGISAVFGLPLLFLTFQLMCGRQRVWLPQVILNRSFARRDYLKLIGSLLPGLKRIETITQPRISFLTRQNGERLIGSIGFLLSIIIFLPIPFGNMLPGLALSLYALGILERDGIAVICGTLAAAASFILVSGVVYGIMQAGIYLLQKTASTFI